MNAVQQCAESYGRLKNLKLVGLELGIPWQSVYVHLKRAGVAVTGDKERYGSDKDRLATRAEQEFHRLVPSARSLNDDAFQPKIDFRVGEMRVDVKASTLHGQGPNLRWTFSLKKQERIADFIVCFGYLDARTYKTLLLPGEIIRKYTMIGVPLSGKSKWSEYNVRPEELAPFFASLLGMNA